MSDAELYGSDIRLNLETSTDYVGMGADLSVNRKGDIQTISGRENLGQALLQRLLTRRGELASLGHPWYGSRLHELIGRPNNQETRDLVRLYAKECVKQEPRVREIVEITVSPQGGNPNGVVLDITVVPIKSNIPMNLIFPFYLEMS
ncbi:MAG TPA: GPW/gp25 family protein [Methanocella sp.]|uniref:GPW/gp25 family protein n=1 Tax=Methanocella sp. TaxID=2052833 RepID=UPI002B8579A9|nr:GPW/gp25 family protein [Methanocella sp.]HTY90423.1 GPW/gp25 family protein [Methanocella sp.]